MDDKSRKSVDLVQPASLQADESLAPSSSELTSDGSQAFTTFSQNLGVHNTGQPDRVANQEPVTHYKSLLFNKRQAAVVSIIITVIITLLTGGGLLLLSRQEAPKEEQKAAEIQDLVPEGTSLSVLPRVLQDSESALYVSGDIISSGSIKIGSGPNSTTIKTTGSGNSNISLPSDSGTLCLDSNNCNYASLSQLDLLQQQVNGIVVPDIPAGIVNAITALQGTANQISVSVNNGSAILSAPQNLDAAANVQFGSLTLPVGGVVNADILRKTSGGTGVTIDGGTGSINLTAAGMSFTAAGGVDRFVVDNSGNTAVSGSLTLGSALAVSYGGTGATNATAARTNLGAAASGANTDITSLAPSASLSIGSTSQNLTLQGFNTVVTSTNNGFVTTLGFNGTAIGNVVYNLDRSASAGTYAICTTVGNCTGVGGSVTTPGGTTNRLAKFGAAQSITDSSISDNGTSVTILGSTTLAVQGGNVTIGQASTATGSITFATSANAFTTTLLAQATASNLTFTLPSADGAAGECLKTNASGVLSFGACLDGGAGGGGGVTSLNGLSGALTVANATSAGSTITINDASTSAKGIAQFNATNFSVTSGVVNTIQDISTTASPTFGGLTLGTLTGVIKANNGAISAGTVTLGTETTGAYVANLGTLTGLNAIGNSGAGSTPTLAVIYGNTANSAVEGDTTLQISAGTGLTGGGTLALGDGGTVTLNVSYGSSAGTAAQGNTTLSFTGGGNLTGSVSGTAGGGFSTNTLDIVSSPVFSGTLSVQGASISVGAAAQAGSLVVHDGTGQTATIQLGNIAANTVLTLPGTLGATDIFCFATLANCADGGVLTVGTFSTTNTAAGGAIITGTEIVFQSASATAPGMVDTGTQTFAGNKTFNNNVTVAGLIVNYAGTGNAFRVNDDGTDTDSTPFIIDQNGKVAIGASTATFDLTLGADGVTTRTIGVGNKSTYSEGTNLVIQSGNGYAADGSAKGGYLLLQAGAASGTGNEDGSHVYIIGGSPNENGASGNVILGHNGTTARGNVGVGDSTPAALLTVGNGDLFQINSSGDITTSNAEPLSIATGTTGSLTLDSGTTGAINIGTNANAKAITIGNVTGSTSLTLNSGTGAINIGTSIAKTITIGNSTNTTGLILRSGTGDVAIQSQDDILIGTNAVAQDITIGNTTGATSLTLNSGTGAINIGTSIAKTITIGNATSTSALILQSGTGDVAIQSQDDILIGTNAVAQDIVIGNSTGATGLTFNAGTGGVRVQTPELSNSFRVNGPGGTGTAVNPVQTLLAGNPTSSCCATSGTGTNLGFRFKPTRAGQITKLGLRSAAATRTVKLYRVDGSAELASVSVAATGIGSWVYADITPVNVSPDVEYAVAVYYASGETFYHYTPDYPLSTGGITLIAGAWADGTGFPSNSASSYLYGVVDLTFVPTPLTTDPIFNVDSIQGYVGIMQGSNASLAPLHVGGGHTGTYVQDIESNLNDFLNTSNSPWTRSDSLPGGGVWSARSGSISADEFTSMSMTKKLQSSGNISFKRKVSSESSYDFLCFRIDNIQQACWSGEVAWSTVSYAVSAGTHTFTWEYYKDGSGSSGSDASWIDDVTITNVSLGTTSALFDQSVGIGTSSPAGRLHVVGKGTSTDYALNITNSAATSLFTIQDNGNINLGNASTANTIQIGGNGSSTLNLHAGNLGTIGVGNAGLSNTIQIGNTTGTVAQTINIGNNATAGSTSTLNIGSTIGASTLNLNAGSGKINLTSDIVFAAGANRQISIGGNSGNNLTLNPGTNTEGTGGTLSLIGGAGNTAGTVSIQGGTSSACCGKGGDVTITGGDGGDFAAGGSVTINGGWGDSGPGYLLLQTGDMTANVGINTIAPNKRLEINLGTNDNLRLTYDDFNGSAASYADLGTTSGGGLTVVANNLTTSGTAGLQGTFTIAGTGASQNYYGNRLLLTNSQTTNANTLYGQYISFTDVGSLANTVTGLYVDATTANGSDITYAAILQGGNVGIGDTTPTAPLTVGDGDLFQVNSSGAIAAVTGITTSGNILPGAAGTIDVGSATTEFNNLFLGDNNGLKLGLDQDATLAYDETTDDRIELTGTGASMFIEDRLGLGAQTLTLTDDGVANDTLTPTSSYVRIDIDETANVGVPDMTISEATAKDGDILIIVNNEQDASEDALTITNSAGVVHLPGATTVTLGPNDTLTLMYMNDRWVTLSVSDN